MIKSSRWALDKQLKDEYLHPSVMRFCAGLPVYRLREITDDNWEIEQEVEKSSAGKNLQITYLAIYLKHTSYHKHDHID